ncbi:TPA: hypothetical protein DDZ86_03900 [Candidatus Dependentiae bacterium]|nr:MAG: hypothetical protein UW09_C0003G0134 [candidate division TM6 bacterium GW2011_GWF2_43_87]HBL98760.1 hypothetical protein [Candidatus Dependentiae bacterium]
MKNHFLVLTFFVTAGLVQASNAAQTTASTSWRLPFQLLDKHVVRNAVVQFTVPRILVYGGIGLQYLRSHVSYSEALKLPGWIKILKYYVGSSNDQANSIPFGLWDNSKALKKFRARKRNSKDTVSNAKNYYYPSYIKSCMIPTQIEIKAHNNARNAALKKALAEGQNLTKDEQNLIDSGDWTTLALKKKSDPALIKNLKKIGVELSFNVLFPLALNVSCAWYVWNDLRSLGNGARNTWNWLARA